MYKVLAWLVGACVAAVVIIGIAASPTDAQSFSRLESRLNRLESENSRLRSRIGRLEGALRRADLAPGDFTAPSLSDEPEAGISGDPMFDRLATLAIELKERIQALEAEVFPKAR